MPGGLTRISATAEDTIVSNREWRWQQGATRGSCRDVPNHHDLAAHATGANYSLLARRQPELPDSRVADNLFWMGRYAERLENTLRLVRCTVVRMMDESGAEGSPELTGLVQTFVRLELLPPTFRERFSLKELEHELLLLLHKNDHTRGVRQIFESAFTLQLLPLSAIVSPPTPGPF